MIEERKLKVGTQLAAKHKGRQYRCEVVVGEEGRVRYRLADGREFKSPSSAGSAVMGGVACNGWRFWSLMKDADAATAETPSAKSGAKKGKKRVGALAKTKPQGNVKVGRNGHKPEVTGRAPHQKTVKRQLEGRGRRDC